MNFEEYMQKIEEESRAEIKKLHRLSKRIWVRSKMDPLDLRNKCLDAWDSMKHDLGTKILPLISVKEDRPVTNLIFGSGSFSTGKFQAEQYSKVREYNDNPPVVLQGIVANKSEDHGCKGIEIAKKNNIPGIILDFNDWYHEYIDKKELNPIRATRYWYPSNSEDIPQFTEIAKRFRIRQNQFHKVLGENIVSQVKEETDIVSARGYNFQFCGNLFAHQKNSLPHVNDTHPADLTYIDRKDKVKLYAGWQSGATGLMQKDGLHHFRGSLIEVGYMDDLSQINELDEGALLSLGQGIQPPDQMQITPKQIQNGLKIMDDYWFCTLEPTGILLTWGITEDAVPVVYQDVNGKTVIVKQKAIVVGDRYLNGINAFGANIDKDLAKLEEFLLEN